jgi:DNA-binding MarR family transcriptional regulator/N-acetylglutamate synthase-like GNAT family acetyltransferase
MPGSSATLEERVDAVRRFNRFYTRRIGVLEEALLRSPFSLTEARILYELAHRDGPTARDLGRDLGLDPGYLSRILRQFRRRGLVVRERSESDGRQSLLALTDRGREAFAALNARSGEDVSALLRALPAEGQARLVRAMRTIEELLGAPDEKKVPYILRPPEAGDFGRVVELHGHLYAQEYGWDETFEALVAGIVARYAEKHDPKRERCWIAEKDEEMVGCVFLVRKSETVAQLRLLLVDPRARGLGIGSRLVSECLRFARAARYRKVVLWTNDVLHTARHLYEKEGFRRTAADRHRSFGHDLVGETWELVL